MDNDLRSRLDIFQISVRELPGVDENLYLDDIYIFVTDTVTDLLEEIGELRQGNAALKDRRWKKQEIDPQTIARCYDCGLPYGSDGWVDVVINDADWELINPSLHKGGGLLCFNCMMRRFAEIGKEDIKILGLFGSTVSWENGLLKQENAALKEENEILKKKARHLHN